jgi:hypothetical protein
VVVKELRANRVLLPFFLYVFPQLAFLSSSFSSPFFGFASLGFLEMGTSVEYQQAHADDDIGKTIIAVNCSMLMLAYIATALRFYSRRLIGAPMKADDWMLTAAVVFGPLGGGA